MMSPSLLEQASAQVLPMIESYLESTAESLRSAGFAVETVIEQEQVAEGILEHAESEGIDLIIIASRGETSATRWRFGSVANKVVRTKTSMPVMVVTT